MIKVAPSILSADFTKIYDAVKMLETAGADYIRNNFVQHTLYEVIRGGETIKIWRTSVEIDSADPGYVVCADAKKGLVAGTGDGLLRIEEMQAPGGKRMPSTDYLRGKNMPGSCFEIQNKRFSEEV